MPNKLAKLDGDDGLKELVNQAGTVNDDVLTLCLLAATVMAEHLAGLAPGGLCRQVDVTEYPSDAQVQRSTVYLGVRPIESITSVKQRYSAGALSEFDGISGLTEFEDYDIADPILGGLRRLNDRFFLSPRCLQVIYTAGYEDPEEELTEGASYPPEDLQFGVMQQAILLWHNRDKAGIERVDLASGGGYMTNLLKAPHPALVASVQRYRRRMA